ncbi:thiamine monophosphate kinase [Sulfurovum lithotrophicum]|uniref:Thiamine-monophosphate kinase n=1 Tax=Sulfurovum lithotrophicum TaxID=206403 RepID=A0A7U4M184_9BACT|nr:thiamine-phosphate kinase [Sulfurovum lithotrophicum]AKF24957.1 thiamine monophosphate kinase [Sulfurovum lithotrophicum]
MDKEHYLIHKLSSKYIGDDAAVVGNTLYSMDAFFEDTHYKRAWMSMTQIGRKAMLVNLSDAIAMNAEPKYALVTISLPQDVTTEEIDALTQSLEDTAAQFGCEIIGGDTVAGDKLHLSIAIISQSDAPLLRKGLEEGDLLAYTGTLGECKRDLDRLLSGETIAENSCFYEPKLRAGFVTKARPFLSAGMDISDGLYCDTNKLLDMNKYGFEILNNISDEIGFSGEEYEMLVGFNKAHLETLKRIAEVSGTTLTVFAEVVKNSERFPCKSHHFL